ncbi:TC10/CDC42 GTPase-activating protein [Thecamonas trahens ATCC 50062]|uniref:TC10/CDC42 GTPase-activating protein n=1 Tax=Thecamonas trahens ATCC 50062 TaxID=461836 RepID=A0A0L0DPC8_THETB|nr:TC10/CDC42 GTPase-activating protein [Thecamonas trahens ATCC 50062]KNC54110.1 TC10/CDC42 GTPase-activating protein [Thecamonas trahens ATCC 50062]|eukprot:XP_013753933.1 TC10/CDC42 GTPase-activating protein [Thecamonas trahens ATCC 50062]
MASIKAGTWARSSTRPHVLLKVPYVVTQVAQHLRAEQGLAREGIFRLSGRSSQVKALKEAFNSGRAVNIAATSSDVFAVAAVLKLWLRELPEPLFGLDVVRELRALAPDVEAARADAEPAALVERIGSLLRASLPPAAIVTTVYLLEFLAEAASHAGRSKMGAANLGIVFGPNLLRLPRTSPVDALQHAKADATIVAFLIDHAAALVAIMADAVVDSSGGESKADVSAAASALLARVTTLEEENARLGSQLAAAQDALDTLQYEQGVAQSQELVNAKLKIATDQEKIAMLSIRLSQAEHALASGAGRMPLGAMHEETIQLFQSELRKLQMVNADLEMRLVEQAGGKVTDTQLTAANARLHNELIEVKKELIDAQLNLDASIASNAGSRIDSPAPLSPPASPSTPKPSRIRPVATPVSPLSTPGKMAAEIERLRAETLALREELTATGADCGGPELRATQAELATVAAELASSRAAETRLRLALEASDARSGGHQDYAADDAGPPTRDYDEVVRAYTQLSNEMELVAGRMAEAEAEAGALMDECSSLRAELQLVHNERLELYEENSAHVESIAQLQKMLYNMHVASDAIAKQVAATQSVLDELESVYARLGNADALISQLRAEKLALESESLALRRAKLAAETQLFRAKAPLDERAMPAKPVDVPRVLAWLGAELSPELAAQVTAAAAADR